ncbi:CvpA family protein [Sphingosinicella rhizophila]|uniref:CvpA family protein n=1 Tax=Sphingosinicella rhizophila TaxID=3050082 RepID=A0ABU3Q379_9SPHN|nr:CvpA family protein [Sphingosinicella sp. GR2756]MDT9597862.1 CvpA family protein [Sphingosinicella sp. GR2756]
MTALDIIVLLLLGGGLIRGSMRGFVGEVLSLLAWVAAVIALKLMHEPVTQALAGTVGTYAGAAVLAFALVFGLVFLCGRLLARRIGQATRTSVVGPIDRILGAGFGVLKGLLVATLLYLAANLFYDTFYGRAAERPDWMARSRTYPLLHASGRAIVDFVETRRAQMPEPPPSDEADNKLQNQL